MKRAARQLSIILPDSVFALTAGAVPRPVCEDCQRVTDADPCGGCVDEATLPLRGVA